jgi:hypothetical protein
MQDGSSPVVAPDDPELLALLGPHLAALAELNDVEAGLYLSNVPFEGRQALPPFVEPDQGTYLILPSRCEDVASRLLLPSCLEGVLVEDKDADLIAPFTLSSPAHGCRRPVARRDSAGRTGPA